MMRPKITRVQEVQRIDEQGRLMTVIQATFSLGENGPFTESMPRAEFSPMAMAAKIEAYAKALLDLTEAS